MFKNGQIFSHKHRILLLVCILRHIDIHLNLLGYFNVYNALAAIATALAEGVTLENIKKSLATMEGVSGRMELVSGEQDFQVIVDYAHTPDALEKVLKTIKEFAKGKIITVFGCGGSRDISKRKVMGGIASHLSDYMFITSDNPRKEDPIKIIKDIEDGIGNGFVDYRLIVDREEAIEKAIDLASPEVLIAGKGHENYQILSDKTIIFDDREVARKKIIQK